jgi:hypothetical protein
MGTKVLAGSARNVIKNFADVPAPIGKICLAMRGASQFNLAHEGMRG